MQDKIRNFCIIAHIDHGKSTLADRMLELTGTIDKRKMQDQMLDRMDIERERGITIKLQPVKMAYKGYDLNLIDTPGHVDFSYEVSRSLAAVEGAILLVDSTQGIQAQTLANLYLAMEQDLKIIPVINKIDLPAADVPKTKNEIINLLGCDESEIISASGKTGVGVEEILDAAIKEVEAPKGQDDKPARALIFDSNYDEYRGVVAFVRVVDGSIKKGDRIKLMATGAESEAIDVGFFKPNYVSAPELKTGDIGYIVTGFKGVAECHVGDTVCLQKNAANKEVVALKGYTEVKPMVFAGVYPQEGNDYGALREAIGKLKLNDSSLSYEPEQSNALGFGFRCGFLGILHLEIFQERLRREHNIELIVTLPSVAYKVHRNDGSEEIIRTPQKLPERTHIDYIEEPWVNLDIIVPKEYIGAVMNLTQEKRGIYKNTEYIDDSRAVIHYQIPMAAILTDYYDKIKSVSSGYASINYEYYGFSRAEVVKMDILVAEEKVEALATIVYDDEAFMRGKEVVKILKESLPRQMFAVKLQASVGAKVVAAERMTAMKKDVTAKLYGGDVTRKRKLLEKQKKGKKKMAEMGRGKVDIPADTFVRLLKK